MEDTDALQMSEPIETINTIYVKSNRKLSKENLTKIFEQYGKIKSINIKAKKKYGFIEFYDRSTFLSIMNQRNKIKKNILYI